ncbi:hypothetical protein, partial [Stutzerimonas stutzeri]|uniref:hypothetical protein n=1 Tax=Stutzerimonas stutzeri TaxID=316 RepID=UPI001C8B75D7
GLWIPGLGVLLPENQGRLPRESAMNRFFCAKVAKAAGALAVDLFSPDDLGQFGPTLFRNADHEP